jgi:hypothetical protein
MKHVLTIGSIAATTLVAPLASAQTSFGQQGDFGFAIERAMGLYSGRQRWNTAGPDIVNDTSAVEIGIGGRLPHPTAMTRIGIDGFVADHLSLGGSIGYASYGDDLDASVFLFAPRIGYFAGISRHVGFWARGGFSYYAEDLGGAGDRSQLVLTAEAQFTFAPNDGFAFLVGPVMDLGLAGSWEPPHRSYRDRVLGVTFGLLGMF